MADQKNHNVFIRIIFPAVMLLLVFYFLSCKHEKTPAPQYRTYRMGFQNFPPKADANTIIAALDMWTKRSDAAIISVQVPWASLYSGISAQKYINDNFVQLVNYYRSKNLKLWVYIDPANGLDRSADASDLAALGKSISEPAVQAVYTRFTFLMDSVLKPEHLGLALEINLIRGASPGAIYQGIKTAVNTTAAKVRAYDKNVKLSVSIQADYAWGLLNASAYIGIDQDFIDFPFLQELGISSYPYFVFNQPQDIPANYYSRLLTGHPIPVFISEGGWSSVMVDKYAETTQKQMDYITKQGQLLDSVKAIAYFQLLFSDINISGLGLNLPSNINLFTHIGLTDTNLVAKPALANWDKLYKRPLVSGN